jgi:hypothetical protein
MRRISGLHATHSKAELQNAIAGLREKLGALRDTHGVSDADDLATELELGDGDWTDVSRWRELEGNLDIAKAATQSLRLRPGRKWESHRRECRIGVRTR